MVPELPSTVSTAYRGLRQPTVVYWIPIRKELTWRNCSGATYSISAPEIGGDWRIRINGTAQQKTWSLTHKQRPSANG